MLEVIGRPAANLRRQATPFGLALAASLVLHAAFFSSLPGAVPRRRAAVRDVVVIELQVPPPGPRDPAAAPLEPSPPAAAALKEEPPAAPPSAATDAARAEPRAPEPPPASPQPAAAVPGPATPSAPTVEAFEAPRPVPRGAPVLRAPAPPQLIRPRSPGLKDLLPRSGELAAYGRAKSLPDPSAPGAREAVVGLGEQDPRYLGYLDQVRTSIYGAWRTGRALLVAGPSRTCLVRFSLNPLGLPGSVEVVRRSGNPSLDEDAVEAVRRARIPPFPSHWTIERLQMEAQFDYVLP